MFENKKDIHKELNKVNDLQQKINQLTPEAIDNEIKKKWTHIKSQISIMDLKKIPVELLDVFSKEDLPIEQLIQDSLDTVYAVRFLSPSYRDTLDIANDFLEAYSSHVFPSLSDTDTLQLELIKLVISHGEQLEKAILEFQEDSHYLLNNYIDQLNIIIEKDTNFVFRLFQRKEKRSKVNQAKKYIQKNQVAIDSIADRLKDSKIDPIPNTLAQKMFKENKADYYAKIKNLTDYQPNPLISNIPYYLRDKLSEFEEDLAQLSVSTMNDEIKEQLEKVKQPQLQEELKNMSLSLLNLENNNYYSISSFRTYGYNNMYDLVNHDKIELLESGMFSTEKLKQLYQDAQKIKLSLQAKLFPRFNPDHLHRSEYKLLKLIYTHIQLNKKIKQKQEDFNHLSIRLINNLIKLEELDINPYDQLFQEKEIVKHIQQLKNDILNDLSKVYSLIAETKQLTDITVTNLDVKNDFVINSASYYAVIESITGTTVDQKSSGLPDIIVNKVKEFDLDTTGLKGTLRPYQKFGTKYALYNKRTLLGDEMGLGKTMQAIAMINHLHQNGHSHSLVVIPLSVMENWKREIKKWSELEVHVFHNSNRDRKREEALSDWKEDGGIMLTTYGHAQIFEYKNFNKLDCLVVDEAHYVKNPEAKRSKQIYKISEIAEYVLYMTGTPLENNVGEMKQLISVLNPELGDQFGYQWDLQNPDNFKRFVSMVYLRRKRDAVLKELPDIETVKIWSSFSPIEESYYDNAVRQGIGGLMKMRRAGFYGQKPSQSEKLKQLLTICDEANENGHKVLIFSFFKSVLKLVKQYLGERTFEVISGEVSNNQRQEIIDEFTSSDAGSVLISQIQAGGVGLNIQAANIVILCEPQWKPSTENQAISRVYRMGQTRNVIVYRLLTKESIDETMMKVLGDKTDIFNLYAKDSDVADAYDKKSVNNLTSETQSRNKIIEIEKKRLEEKEGLLIEN